MHLSQTRGRGTVVDSPADDKPLQRRTCAIEPRFAGNLRLIELGREPGRVGVAGQRLPPGALVR
jgi:hypothetical protein